MEKRKEKKVLQIKFILLAYPNFFAKKGLLKLINMVSSFKDLDANPAKSIRNLDARFKDKMFRISKTRRKKSRRW